MFNQNDGVDFLLKTIGVSEIDGGHVKMRETETFFDLFFLEKEFTS